MLSWLLNLVGSGWHALMDEMTQDVMAEHLASKQAELTLEDTEVRRAHKWHSIQLALSYWPPLTNLVYHIPFAD